MSQYPGAYSDPYAEPPATKSRTSGLAIAALVCSLIFCCPLTTVAGVLMGAIGAAIIRPPKRGRGMAVTALILGVIFTVLQVWLAMLGWNKFVVPVINGPRDALVAGFSGDIQGFKNQFAGTAATLPDPVAQQFIDDLRSRYGAFQSAAFDDSSGGPMGQPGDPSQEFPYKLNFANGTVSATAEMVFADERTGEMIMKWGSLTIHDPQRGDLMYPPSLTEALPIVDPDAEGADEPATPPADKPPDE